MAFKVTVFTQKGEITREYESPVRPADVLYDTGVAPYLTAGCGGRGICGKCAVEVQGALTPKTPNEKQKTKAGDRFRLACVTRITGDAQIFYNTKDGQIQVLSEGIFPNITIGAAGKAGVGTAIDIGTTTVAAAAYDLLTGQKLGEYTCENPQRAHGADVVTRMDFAEKGGLLTLQKEIGGVIGDILAKTKAVQTVVTGNTAMLHFAAGLSTEKMSKAPFEPESLFGKDVVLTPQPGVQTGPVYLAPCASAYFGGDAVFGMAACEIEKEYPGLFADIGTNGEMALFDGKTYYACSTAAGPAFEGYGIECGMPAVKGAIHRVWTENGGLKYAVIGGGTAKGLCGSGLADCIAALIDLGVVDQTGFLAKAHMLSDDVYITPRDVRNLQLAKAAIRAGIETLLDESRARGKIKAFYLAGGLGASINIDSAVKIGLVPKEFAPVAFPAGNAALSGAAAALLDRNFRKKTEKIARKCQVVELADSAAFGEYFIKYMTLED